MKGDKVGSSTEVQPLSFKKMHQMDSAELRFSMPCIDRDVLKGVGADGVGVKFPIFPARCSCLLKKNEQKQE